MDTEQLNAFLRIVREGGFSRAAYSLGIGQPSVSSRIQSLENAVGGTLFTRGRRVALTPLGETFLPYARRALEVLSEGLELARLAKDGGHGRVTLGVLGSLAEGLIGPALATFIQRHPAVECIIKSGDHETLVGLLWDRIIDLALIAWPCADPFAVELSPLLLLEEPVLLAAHPKHPMAIRQVVTQDELVREANPLLLLRWWPTHHPELVRLSRLAGGHVEIPKETALHLVRSGVGVGFFPRTYLARDLEQGSLVEISVRDLPKLMRMCALVSRTSERSIAPPAKAFVDAITREADRLQLSKLRPSRR